MGNDIGSGLSFVEKENFLDLSMVVSLIPLVYPVGFWQFSLLNLFLENISTILVSL